MNNQPQILIPLPSENECPSGYADRLGRWYMDLTEGASHRKSLGQFLTPVKVASFMAGLLKIGDSNRLRVLDPGAGAGVLSCALCEALVKSCTKIKVIELEAYEVDSGMMRYLGASLSYAKQWVQGYGITLNFTIKTDDFITTYADLLDNRPRLFPNMNSELKPFDIVISNPPYFKISGSDPRARVAANIVYGQPNIYALFMIAAALLLKPDGQLLFITPRSYAAGSYFQRFREQFFAFMQPEAIHLFDSRRDTFGKDEVLQENIILLARKLNSRPERNQNLVRISFSVGVGDLVSAKRRDVPLSAILDFSTDDKILRIPLDDEDDDTVRVVRSWTGSLQDYGLKISTGPVVPFRAIGLLSKTGQLSQAHAPLIWMQHVQAMKLEWPTNGHLKEQYITINAESRSLLLENKNYVVLRRFSAKEQPKRLIAAPLLTEQFPTKLLGLENHLNYIYRSYGSLTPEETFGLAVLLNSTLLDRYFRTFSGNTQVSATELRAMPLPPLKAIQELGRCALEGKKDL